MDSRMDLSALERSRLLNSLPSSALGHLGLSALASSEQSHSSALNRLSAASAAAAAAAAGASPPDLARAGSPTAGLSSYPGRYLPPSALHSPGASYAMMAGYLGGGSQIPDSFKATMPEFQQYWGTSQEAYARQLLASMYYPYLPYLPATESLSLFAQNSAAHVQAAAQAQAHAAHHRIYDLHKEALLGPGAIPGGFFPPSLLLQPPSSTSQEEATNLSVPTPSKSKHRDETDRHKHLDILTNKSSDNAKKIDGKTRPSEDDKLHTEDGSERTRGLSLRKPSDDYMKYRNSDYVKKSSPSASTSSYSVAKTEHDRKRSKLEAVIKQAKENGYDPNASKPSAYRCETYIPDRKRGDKLSSPVGYREHFMPVSAFSPSHKTAFHSPTRTERVVSPNRSTKAHSPIRSQKLSSPIQIPDTSLPVQDKPENLCVKDRNPKSLSDTVKHADTETKTDAVIVKTQSIVTGATITVTSTLNIITSDLPSPNQVKKGKRETDSSPNLPSPSLSSPSSGNTTTTYSLPYYHNLYSRSQSNSQEGKKVHAVTYIPEIGTIPSPFAVSPPTKDSRACAKFETESKHSPKLKDDSLRNDLPESKPEDHKPEAFVIKSSHPLIKTETDNKAIVIESKRLSTEEGIAVDVECHNKNLKDKTSFTFDNAKSLSQQQTETEYSYPKEEKDSINFKNETLKRRKSISPKSIITEIKTIDLTNDKDGDVKTICDSAKSGDLLIREIKSDLTKDEKTEKDNKMVSSAINSKASSCASKVSQNSCDLNHNSQSEKETHSSGSGNKDYQSNVDAYSIFPSPTGETSDRTDKRKILAKHSPVSTIPETIANTTENQTDIKKPRQSESGKLTFKDEKPVKFKETDKVSSKDKRNHGTSTGSTIPVGIAVARQRNIAPKTDKDSQKPSDEIRGKSSASAEIKPVRPLKIIRPSSKGKPQGASDFRTELPANLIVTGGSTNNGGLFWSNDQASRQLAAQYLQPGAQINQSNWFDQSHVSFPHTNHATTSEGGQLPFSVPPGFKLAQDSLTGGILLIPTATDVYDSSRMFSGFPVGAPNTQNFGHSLLTTSQTQSNIPTAGSTFVNQPSINGSTHFPAPFCPEVLSRPEASVKEEKREINTQHNTDAIITTTVGLTAGQDNGAVSMIVHQDIDKNKIMTVPPPSFVTDLSLTGGQQCAYTFHPPTMPYIFNPSVLSVHNIPEPAPDINPLKVEQTSVQSRGTSPMLPATDSSNEENEECSSQPDEKIEKIEKTDEHALENDEVCKSKVCTEKLEIDLKGELSSYSVPRCDKDNDKDDTTEYSKLVVDKIDETPKLKDTLVDSVCDKTSCDSSEINHNEVSVAKVSVHNIPVSDTIRSNHETESDTESILLEPHTNDIQTQHIDCKMETLNSTDTVNNEMKPKSWRASKTDRNIFSDLNEYNPFTDPQILEATDGLELLSTLAEKSIISLNNNPNERKLSEQPEADAAKEDVFAFKDDAIPPSKSLHTKKERDKETIEKSPTETTKPIKSRIKCGYDFKPKQAPDPDSISPVRMTTFCGITIPEDLDSFLHIDDDVIDSIEMEMKMRLMELQKRYREKQKELLKLKPKKEREKNKEDDKGKELEPDTSADTKRGRGRPKKRKVEEEDNAGKISESQTTKTKSTNKEVATPHKSQQNNKTNSKTQSSPHTNGSHGNQNSNNGSHGSNKKKKRAEMLVDRVFRKAGSSFKIPLSKKISLIAPARIELPGATCNTTDKSEPSHAKKTLDFRGLIKGSRLSQLNGKDRSFDGGLWKRKEERRREEKRKHSQSSSTENRQKKHKKQEVESGLGLLAEYATKYQEETIREKEKTEKLKKKRKHENEASMSSPESPNKKRKPGRPKKCDLIRPGVTETIVAKQSKHMDFFRWQKDEKPERKISLEGKTPLKPLYLDEWNVRRSERIFLSDTSPQTSPNNTSPVVKPVPADEKYKSKEKGNEDGKGTNAKEKECNLHKPKATKKHKSNNLQDISQKLKKKYSTTFNQKSKDKTSELLKARDKLTQKRHTKKLKKLSKSEVKDESESDTSTDDLPLSTLKAEASENATVIPSCIIDKDELQDGLRILIFMDGLFHEGEVKAIRPPDVYGAILDKERRTRPHICSQEEILRDAIKDAKPSSIMQLKEGTRVCAYWSQQFNCLYPGTVSRASPDPHADKSLVNVEFDDGDTGKIPIDHIRLIPQDFPIVEYDPHPLLLLTKRRRTLSTSESSEPRISCSNIPPSPKEDNASTKRGPGRPSKADRLTSVESIGDEDVFTNGTNDAKTDIDDDNKSVTSEKGTPKKQKNKQSVPPNSPRQLWKWSGSSTKKPGLKGKARKEYYKCIVRGRETIMVGECAVFLSTGRPNLPYVGRIESLYEGWGGQMVVKVKWFYHPEETKGGRRLQNMKGALFRSDHEDENDVQTISHKCEVLKYEEFRKKKSVISLDEMNDVYYLAGSYQPTIGHIKFEPGVI